MTAQDLHALAIQLQLCGERGGTVPPDVLAKVGAARAERTARQQRIIQDLLAMPGAANLSILKRETE